MDIFGKRFGIQWFLTHDTTGGGGGGVPDDDPAPRQTAADVVARYSGDAVRMAGQIAQLESDNYRLRGERRNLRSDHDALKGKVPGEGAVVLTQEQAADWDAFQKLGKASEVVQQVTDGRTAITERDNLKREGLLRDVASENGFKFSVLKQLDAQTPGSEFVKKTVSTLDASGQIVTRDAWVVRRKEGEGEAATIKETPVSEYAQATWKDFLPALQAPATDENAAPGTVPGVAPAAPALTLFPAQTSGTNASLAGDPVQAFINQSNAARGVKSAVAATTAAVGN